MSLSHIAVLVLYALGMSIGQVLFRLSADEANTADGFFSSLFGESLDLWYILGLGVILFGPGVLVSKGT